MTLPYFSQDQILFATSAIAYGALGIIAVMILWALIISPLLSRVDIVNKLKNWIFPDEMGNDYYMGNIYKDMKEECEDQRSIVPLYDLSVFNHPADAQNDIASNDVANHIKPKKRQYKKKDATATPAKATQKSTKAKATTVKTTSKKTSTKQSQAKKAVGTQKKTAVKKAKTK